MESMRGGEVRTGAWRILVSCMGVKMVADIEGGTQAEGI